MLSIHDEYVLGRETRLRLRLRVDERAPVTIILEVTHLMLFKPESIGQNFGRDTSKDLLQVAGGGSVICFEDYVLESLVPGFLRHHEVLRHHQELSPPYLAVEDGVALAVHDSHPSSPSGHVHHAVRVKVPVRSVDTVLVENDVLGAESEVAEDRESEAVESADATCSWVVEIRT